MQFLFFDIMGWSSLTYAFSWMLVHSLWQGMVLTVLTAAVILFTKKSSAHIRYNIITVLFFTFLFVCFFTFLYELNAYSDLNDLSGTVVNAAPGLPFLNTVLVLTGPILRLNAVCSSHSQMIASAWLLVFVFKMSQVIRSLIFVNLISSRPLKLPDHFWLNKVTLLSAKLNIKRQVRLVESAIVKIPLVAGYFKPIIFVPAGLLTNLAPDQVEAILMHELGHIRRNDYCINLIQNISETFFFFNPALLWVSALMKEERENCCDDIAIDHTKNKQRFLEALLSFKSQQTTSITSQALAFPGNRNLLLDRFKRIVYNENKGLSLPEKIFFGCSLLATALLMLVALSGQHKQDSVERKAFVSQLEQPALSQAKKLSVSSRLVSEAQRAATGKTSRHSRSKTILLAATNRKRQPVAADAIPISSMPEERIEKVLPIAVMGNEDEKLAMDRQQEAEQLKEKIETQRLQIDIKKEQSSRDAQIARQQKLQAETDAQRAAHDRLQALKMKEKATADAELIHKGYLTNQAIR